MADIAAAERKGDDDTMVLPGDEMSLSSFWWTEAEGKKVREGKKAQMVDVSARRAAPSHIYTMVTTIIPVLSAFPSTSRNDRAKQAQMPSTSDVNRSAQRKGGKKGRRSRAGGAQLSSYDAAGASMALPRDNLSECQTPFPAVPCLLSVVS